MKTHHVILSLLIVIAVFIYSTTTFALKYNPTTATNIIADGFVDAGEWSQADYEADGFGLLGAMYGQWSDGYQAGAINYPGFFRYLLHNIEQLQTNEDADYNAFDIFDSSNTLALRVWIFDDVDEASDAAWMTAAGLTGYGASIVDTGFVVYNVALDEYRKYDFGDTRPEDGGYDWDYYWGVYGAGGFNNSAFENGLNLSIDNNNEVYELICRDCTGVRRSIKDPDDLPDSSLVLYFEGDIKINDNGKGENLNEGPLPASTPFPIKVKICQNSVSDPPGPTVTGTLSLSCGYVEPTSGICSANLDSTTISFTAPGCQTLTGQITADAGIRSFTATADTNYGSGSDTEFSQFQ